MNPSSSPQQPITATMQVEDLVREYPDAVGLLMREHIVCIKCGEPYWGTIGDLIESKGMDVAGMLARLNAALNKS
jgi:hypothetical protein